jgi:hypothetical protein
MNRRAGEEKRSTRRPNQCTDESWKGHEKAMGNKHFTPLRIGNVLVLILYDYRGTEKVCPSSVGGEKQNTVLGKATLTC